MDNKPLTLCVVLSFLLNVIVSLFMVYTIKSPPVFTGDYDSENINLVARIQRANFLGEVLRERFEIDGGVNLPIIISQLAENRNPQLWTHSEEYVLLKINSQSLTILTREETEAVIAHELAHIILGHSFKGPNEKSDIKEEGETDRFIIKSWNIKPHHLKSAITKLSHNEEEKRLRLEAIDF